jgi:glycosyltransferase involved in cell wall biosynthesis
LKICILTTGHPALDGRIFYKEALSLRKTYNDITLIVPDDCGERMEHGIKIIGVGDPRKIYSIWDRFKMAGDIVNKAIEIEADVYHFHDYELIFKVGKIKRKLPNCKLIYDVHEHYPDMMRRSRKFPNIIKPLLVFAVDKAELYYAKKFDQIITADDATKERFKPYNERVDIIYNFTEFRPQAEKENKASENMPTSESIPDPENIANSEEDVASPKVYDLIYQGDITLERGVYHVVQAIKILREKFPDIKMVFVGAFNDTLGKEIVDSYIAENNLQGNIEFTGRVPHTEVEHYIRKSKIGLVTLMPVPKFYKNIPTKQFEYMSCGLPVVGSNLPPIQRFLTPYNSGIIVDPTKPEEIAKAIGILLSDPRLCEEMGQNGIKAVREEYNWGKMEELLLKIYSRLEKPPEQ